MVTFQNKKKQEIDNLITTITNNSNNKNNTNNIFGKELTPK